MNAVRAINGDLATGLVVVVGSLNMDLVVTTSHIPAAGETVLGDSFSTLPGGKGGNQAVAAARAGAPVAMVGRLGADAYGDTLRAGLVDEGIDVVHVGTCKHDPSGVALISVSETGENAIVVAPGANSMIRTLHVDDAAEAGLFAAANVVLLQLEIPLDVMSHAAALAHKAGAVVVLNPAPAKQLPESVWQHVDVLIANETEIDQLGGIDSLTSIVATVVATLGDDGIVVHHKGEVQSIESLAVEVIDTTGAGDCFCGWFAAELAGGNDVFAAAALANVAAGLSVTSLGARTSPTAVEVDAYLAN